MTRQLKTLFLAFFATASLSMAGGEGWMTDLEAAKAKAKKENKALLVEFSGSDWCHWCKVLNKEVFSKEDFTKEAEKEFVLVELDFPQRKKQSPSVKAMNEKIAAEHGIRGFPTVLLMTPEGKVFKRTGYQKGGVKSYLAMLKDALSLM